MKNNARVGTVKITMRGVIGKRIKKHCEVNQIVSSLSQINYK